jgi:hypothetical protein
MPPKHESQEDLKMSTSKQDEDEVRTIDFLDHDDGNQGNGWGRGIVKDFRKTVGTHWVNEMTNFNQKSIADSFFIFFAAVAPAITFGAVYSKVRFPTCVCVCVWYWSSPRVRLSIVSCVLRGITMSPSP